MFRECVLTWAGEEYTFTPTMRLLQRIESDGTSLMHVAHQVSAGKPQVFVMARILAMVMQDAGARVSEEEILEELLAADGREAVDLYGAVMEAITPERKPGKKGKKGKPND